MSKEEWEALSPETREKLTNIAGRNKQMHAHNGPLMEAALEAAGLPGAGPESYVNLLMVSGMQGKDGSSAFPEVAKRVEIIDGIVLEAKRAAFSRNGTEPIR